jgi:hypothetical protein
MGGMEMSAKGYNGVVSFDGRMVTITRTGLGRATLGKGSKAIPLRQITGVQLKPAGRLVNGYIAFTIPGGVEQQSRMGSATYSATKDENAVIFTRGQAAEFEALQAALNSALAAL